MHPRCAGPHPLGEIKKHLASSARGKLVSEISKDLTRTPATGTWASAWTSLPIGSSAVSCTWMDIGTDVVSRYWRICRTRRT